jgi:hypothetical protein
MPHFDDSLTVGQALDEHLRIAGFTKETYGPWLPIKLGPLRFRLPNPPWRQRTLILHDLHDTSFAGEAQVSAWEARTGCRGLPPVGYAIIYGAMITGWFADPHAVRRAWTADVVPAIYSHWNFATKY